MSQQDSRFGYYKDGEFIPIGIDKRLENILLNFVGRLDKKDIWILISGKEGAGKSNMLAYLLKFFAVHTGRKLDVNNLYFDADALREYAQSHDNALLGWDEASIGGLSSQWLNKSQIYLMQFGMTGRIKHHIIIMCIPNFEKLKDYFIGRANMMINVYTIGDRYGRYRVYDPNRLALLYQEWRVKKRLRLDKWKNFNGYCPEVFTKIFSEEEQKIYEKNKLNTISNIGKVKVNKEADESDREIKQLKYKIGSLKFPIQTQQEFAEYLNITPRAIQKWRQSYENNLYNPTP